MRLQEGVELAFEVDTGSDTTILDKSLEPLLGRRIGTGHVPVPFDSAVGPQGIYKAPKLSLGRTQLLAAPQIVTMELHSRPSHPYKGILGMDCLQHYCIQLDFAAGKMCFLDPDHLDTHDLGRAFPITAKPGRNTVCEGDLFGQGNMQFLVDTGFCGAFDAMLAPKLFQRFLREHKPGGADLTMTFAGGESTSAASFPRLDFCCQTYTDLYFGLVDIRPKRITANIGLRFVARHLATFNFPKRTIYLKPRSGGPLTDSRQTPSAPRPYG